MSNFKIQEGLGPLLPPSDAHALCCEGKKSVFEAIVTFAPISENVNFLYIIWVTTCQFLVFQNTAPYLKDQVTQKENYWQLVKIKHITY